MSTAGDQTSPSWPRFMRACFAEAWTRAALRELLAAPGTFACFVDADGFILARVAADEAEILTLAVRPGPASAGRRRGARPVLQPAMHASSGRGQIFLEVAASNRGRAGALCGTWLCAKSAGAKGYYAFGPGKREDALILRSNLPLSRLGNTPASG